MTIFNPAGELPRHLLPRPPGRFDAPKDVHDAKLMATGPFQGGKRTRVSGARAAGIRYEKKVHDEMLRRYRKFYINNVWFKYFDGDRARWCQPDGLMIDAGQGQIIIVEVKYQHTGDAWWQLHKLYLPVVRNFFGETWTYRCVEIVRWYEATVYFPGSKLCERIHFAPALPFTGVHICTP